jgi:hypothetical protein
MSNHTRLTRSTLTLLLIASLGACAVVPVPRYVGSPAPVYVETAPTVYYGGYGRTYDNRHYRDNNYQQRGYRQERYREPERREYRHEQPEPRRESSTRIPSPLEVHRDVRRSLGLPRLPGMP